MRCLIIGSSGQVGTQLVAACDDRDLVHTGTYYRRPIVGALPLDLRDDEALDELFDDFEPDVTFLPAAETHVDRAEQNADECLEMVQAEFYFQVFLFQQVAHRSHIINIHKKGPA